MRIRTRRSAIMHPEIDDDRLRELWANTSMGIMDICWSLGAFHREVMERARVLGLPPRPRVLTPEVDPSEDEISERAAEIRRTRWTEDEEDARRSSVALRWEIPAVTISTRDRR